MNIHMAIAQAIANDFQPGSTAWQEHRGQADRVIAALRARGVTLPAAPMSNPPLISALTETEDPETNFDEHGRLEVSALAQALLTWHGCQNRDGVTVAEAAAAFNATPDVIREAAEWSGWLTIGDDGTFDEDGI